VTTQPTAIDAHPEDPLLDRLNDEQREAVLYGDGPLLLLAGAGSGKTRAITHRVAWLVERRNVAPWRILAVTFTNKAAGEMRERLQKLLGPTAADVQVSTFHAAGAAILRREAEKVGRTRSFVIYDDADQIQLIRRALQESGVGDRIKPQLVRHRIDHAKNHALSPDQLPAPAHDYAALGVKKAYARYEQLLQTFDKTAKLARPQIEVVAPTPAPATGSGSAAGSAGGVQ
jgi:DNA helicase-2/ATP-dependent DNA helicase PcrA